MMHGHEKSRSAIVAVKPTNKVERTAAEQSAAEPTAAEPVERRAETKGSADQQRTRRTQRRISVSKMLARIRQHIVAVDTQGGNRMRESCTYGSVRGVRGNSHPYRDAPAESWCDHIEGSGVAWAHLHPHYFMDNLLAASPVVDGKLYWFMGQQAVGWVAPEDVAA